MIPDFATVRRCGGSCDMHSHRCVATTTRMRRLEVMVVLSQFPSQRTVTECGFVEVRTRSGSPKWEFSQDNSLKVDFRLRKT